MKARAQRIAFKAATLVVPVLALVLGWRAAAMAGYATVEQAAAALERLGQAPLGWAMVPLGFALGCLLFVPLNALIAAVTLSFDPVRGFMFALVGGLIAAAVAYGFGLLIGPSFVELLRGPRVDRVIEKMRASSFRTSLLLHLMPVGTFTLVNLLAGALEVPFGGFLLGTAIGLLPGLVFFVLLSGGLHSIFP